MVVFIAELNKYLMLHTLLNWALTFIPLVAAVMVAYHFLMRIKADDEQLAAQHMRTLKATLTTTLLLLGTVAVLEFLVKGTPLDQYVTKIDPKAYAPCYGIGFKEQPDCSFKQ